MIEKNSTMPPHKVRQMMQACFANIRDEADATGPYIAVSPDMEMELLEQEALAGEEISRLSGQVGQAKIASNVQLAVEGLARSQGVVLGALPPADRDRFIQGAIRVLVEKQRLYVARLRDPLADYQPSDEAFAASKGLHSPLEAMSGTKGISIGQAVEEYLAAKAKVWTKRTLKARRIQLAYLTDCIGPQRPLASVTEADVRGFRNALTKFRSNRGRQKSLSFHERLTESSKHQVSNKTAAVNFEPAKAFFRWAKEDEGYLAVNPAADVKWQGVKQPKTEKSRRPFTEAELRTLFSSPVFVGCKSEHRRFEPGPKVVKDDRYWIAIIGYYTGARLGEIVQLHVDDVVLDHEVPHFDLNEAAVGGDLKHIKTAAGVRKIPIHPDIIELGFADFVVARRKWKKPSKRLFSRMTLGADGQASTQSSKLFARMFDKLGLDDPSLTFHSFRHGAEDAFRDAGVPQYTIDAIMGHSDGKVSSMYGQGPSLNVKAAAVQGMKVPLSLPEIMDKCL